VETIKTIMQPDDAPVPSLLQDPIVEDLLKWDILGLVSIALLLYLGFLMLKEMWLSRHVKTSI
jgi:hypothetical protein